MGHFLHTGCIDIEPVKRTSPSMEKTKGHFVPNLGLYRPGLSLPKKSMCWRPCVVRDLILIVPQPTPTALGSNGEGRQAPALEVLCGRRARRPEGSCLDAAAHNGSKVIAKDRGCQTTSALLPSSNQGWSRCHSGPCGREGLLCFDAGCDACQAKRKAWVPSPIRK